MRPPHPDSPNRPLTTAASVEAALHHRAWVRQLAATLVGDSPLADDVAQEAWSRAFASPPPTGATWRGWLAGVVRNVVRDSRRSEARRTRREARAARDEAVESTAELLERVEEESALVQLVVDLDEPYRSVILRRYFDDWSVARIARESGAPEPTVRTRLRRGLARLREALDEEHGGDRGAWVPSISALAAPIGISGGTKSLAIGTTAMGTMMKVSAGVLFAAACLYFATRPASEDTPRSATTRVEGRDADSDSANRPGLASAVQGPTADATRRSVATSGVLVATAAPSGTNVLRVILDGVTDAEAQLATVTLEVWDEAGLRVDGVEGSWSCRGSASEFVLDDVFASVTRRGRGVGTLIVAVDHPDHLLEQFRLLRADGVETEDGRTVHQARVNLTGIAYWPALTLSVRDADTREHLENVEVHCIGTEWMNLRRQPGPGLPYSELVRGSSSPVALMGGHKVGEPENVGAVAVPGAAGRSPRVVELAGRAETERGVVVYARAPGYEWGRLVVDFSASGNRELLLGRGASLDVQLNNVRLDRYAALGTDAELTVRQPGWGVGTVWAKAIDSSLVDDGLRLEGIEPGELSVSVRLGSEWSSRTRPVLAEEELTLTPGEARELVLTLADPPAPPERVTLRGRVSFPEFDGEQDVRLQLFHPDSRFGDADAEVPLADMVRVDGALPTWSFEFEDVPTGTCQLQLLPLLKNWMVEVPIGGRDEVKLEIPELAEVLVETVDARTGARVPVERLRYMHLEELPGRVRSVWSNRSFADFEGEPGLFRFRTVPGTAKIADFGNDAALGYHSRRVDVELAPGRQSIRLELTPPFTFRLEFRVDGATLPYDDEIYWDLGRSVRGVGHDGTGLYVQMRTGYVSAPGTYELDLEGRGTDRFLPVAPQRFEVREGETTDVVVELQRN